MKAIGVTSRCRRGYVAVHRGYIAPYRGCVAGQVCNPLSKLDFSMLFCPLPYFYLFPTLTPCGQVRGLRGFAEEYLSQSKRRYADSSQCVNEEISACWCVQVVSGGGNGASCLVCPPAGRISAQPDRPCGPPLSPRLRRGSPCGLIRARGARKLRDWTTNRYGLQGGG